MTYIDPFSGHVITTVGEEAYSLPSPDDADEGGQVDHVVGDIWPLAVEYSEEEDRVNRCIAGLRRRR